MRLARGTYLPTYLELATNACEKRTRDATQLNGVVIGAHLLAYCRLGQTREDSFAARARSGISSRILGRFCEEFGLANA